MRNLIINRVKYIIKTKEGREFGADVPFEMGLNIIYGPNSVGKSSLVTGIIYCLGAEKGLGIFQSKQNPFKPEFYDKINGEIINTSVILLQISNGEKKVTLARSVIGNKTDIVGLKEIDIDNFYLEGSTKYLIASGEGAFSEKGLQYFLFNFLGWNLVNVPTYDYNTSKLYFENLISLFFIEQRAGWAQIQARQIMRYGIRDIKKVAFEYLMGLDRFAIHLKEIEKKEIQEKLYKLRRDLTEKEERIVILVNGKINDDVLLVDKFGYGRGSVYDILSLLEKSYEKGNAELNGITQVTSESETIEAPLKSNLRIVSHQIRKAVEKINTLSQEIASYESYLERIEINRQKNKQLKKIEKLAPDLNISICPICETCPVLK